MKNEKFRIVLTACVATLFVFGCNEAEVLPESIESESVQPISSEAETPEIIEEEPEFVLDKEVDVPYNESVDFDGLFEISFAEPSEGGAIYDYTSKGTMIIDGKTLSLVFNKNSGTDKSDMYIPELELIPYDVDIVSYSVDSVKVKCRLKKDPENTVTLSGNPEDVYESEDYGCIVGEKCVIFVDKGCKVPGDYLVALENTIDKLEENTGMNYSNDSVYNDYYSLNGWIESYYGEDYWDGFSGGKDRINIILTNDNEREGLISCAFERMAVFANPDFKIHKYGPDTMIHELSHCLQMTNHESYSKKLSEGFATYWEVQLSDDLAETVGIKKEDYSPKDESYYAFSDGDLNASTAEALFGKEYERMDGNQPYEYGFALMTYLYESYSVEEVNEFFDLLDEKIWQRRLELKETEWSMNDFSDKELVSILGDASSEELEAEALKEYFGDDVFKKFGQWYSDNKSRFYKR